MKRGRRRPARRPLLALLALASLAVGTLGCASSGPGLATVQKDLERQFSKAHFEPETRLSLGRFSLGLARRISHMVLDEKDQDEARALAMLDSLRKVEVGVYRVRLSAAERDVLAVPAPLQHLLQRPGWETLVALREGDERMWVLAEHREDQLRSLWVVFHEDEELGLIHLEGRLDRLLRTAFEEDPNAATAMLLEDLM